MSIVNRQTNAAAWALEAIGRAEAHLVQHDQRVRFRKMLQERDQLDKAYQQLAHQPAIARRKNLAHWYRHNVQHPQPKHQPEMLLLPGPLAELI